MEQEFYIIYILTNPGIPSMVKIGIIKSSELRSHIEDLNANDTLPSTFDCYFACKTSEPLVAKAGIEKIFGKSLFQKGKDSSFSVNSCGIGHIFLLATGISISDQSTPILFFVFTISKIIKMCKKYNALYARQTKQ